MPVFKIQVLDRITEMWVYEIDAATEDEAREEADARADCEDPHFLGSERVTELLS